MRAILLKDHHHSTAPDLAAQRPYVLADLGVEVFGGIVLNSYVGGLNPYAVDLTLRMGGRMVWFPTISSANHIRRTAADPELKFPQQSGRALPEAEVEVVDARGELLPAAREVLRLIAEADAAVSPGHLTLDEQRAVLEVAVAAGVRRMIVNHPGFMLEASVEECRELTRLGAYVEHSVAYHLAEHDFGTWDASRLAAWIDGIGPDRTIIATDLGQAGQRHQHPQPVDGLRLIASQLLDLGVREAELELMLKRNPSWVLGLED